VDPEDPTNGRACVFYDVSGMEPGTFGMIGRGAPGDAGTIVATIPVNEDLGQGSGCVDGVDPAVVQAFNDDPTAYFVQIANDPFPDGAVRGQVTVGAVISISVREFVCPGGIRTPADVLAAPQGTCTVAARTGDIGNPPAGFTWDPKPTLFDMRVNLATGGSILTLDDAEAEGGGTCGGKTCSILSFPYVWRDLTPAPMTVAALTAPKGYKFGWATTGPISEGDPAQTGTVDIAHHSISFDATAFGAADGVLITIYNFRGH